MQGTILEVLEVVLTSRVRSAERSLHVRFFLGSIHSAHQPHLRTAAAAPLLFAIALRGIWMPYAHR